MDDEGRTVIWGARDGRLDIDRVVGDDPPGRPVSTVTADGAYRGTSQVGLSPISAPATGAHRPVRGSHQAIATARSAAGLDIVTVSTMGAIRLQRLSADDPEPRAAAGADGQQLVTTIAAALEDDDFAPVCPVTSVRAMDLRLGFVNGRPHGQTEQLVAGDARGQLQLLAVAAGTVSPLAPPWQHRDIPLTAVAAHHGQGRMRVAAGTLDGEVAFWSVDPAGSPTRLTSVHLGSRVLGIGLGDRADAVVWCRHGAVTLTNVRGLTTL